MNIKQFYSRQHYLFQSFDFKKVLNKNIKVFLVFNINTIFVNYQLSLNCEDKGLVLTKTL